MDLKNYPITSQFGEIDNVHSQLHTGVDFAVNQNTPIIAPADGIVTLTTDKFLGNAVRLKMSNGDIIVYGHCSKFEASNGDYVSKGSLLALSGGDPRLPNQGRSTGSHIHCSYYHDGKLTNPMPFINGQIQQDSSSSLVFPIMLILILFLAFRLRKILFYGLGLFVLVGIVFLVS